MKTEMESTWKERLWPISRYCPTVLPSERSKRQQSLFRIASFRAKIWTLEC